MESCKFRKRVRRLGKCSAGILLFLLLVFLVACGEDSSLDTGDRETQAGNPFVETEANIESESEMDSVTESVSEDLQTPTESDEEIATQTETDIETESEIVPVMTIATLISSRYVVAVGESACFYTENLFPQGLDGGEVLYTSDADGFSQTADGFVFSPSTAGEWVLTVTVTNEADRWAFETEMQLVAVLPDPELHLTGLLIGDSRISDGTIVHTLTASMGENLTLLGTRTTVSKFPHEGRSAWSALHYLTVPSLVLNGKTVTNPFYDPDWKQFDPKTGVTSHFHFSYYMETAFDAQAVPPDFVVLFLGANDGYSEIAAEYLRIMTDSIREYAEAIGKEITVLMMTEYFTVTEDYDTDLIFSDLTLRKQKQYRLNLALQKYFGDRENEGILLIPGYAVIGEITDRPTDPVSGLVSDAAHLSIQGYRKQAKLILSYLYWYYGRCP